MSNSALAAIFSGVLLTGAARAQNVYFDPNDTHSASGGSGEFNGPSSWEMGGANGPFVSGENAYFDGTAGDVSVNAPVTVGYLEVGVTSGTENIGTAGADASTISIPGAQYTTPIQVDAGTENVNFNSGINLNMAVASYNNVGVTNNSSGNVAFNGGISFTNLTGDPNGAGEPALVLTNNTAGGSFTINSAVTETGVSGNLPSIDYGTATPSNTLTLTANSTFTNVNVHVSSGTVLDQGATYSGAIIQVDGTGAYLADAANMDVSAVIQNNGGDMILGSALAADTTFSGTISNYDNGDANTVRGSISLTSGAGGTVTFSNSIGFNSAVGQPIYKIGAGTVRLTNSFNNYNGPAEVKNGTLLLDTQNALGNGTLTIDEVDPTAISATQTYAKVGGVGTYVGNVVANGPHSVLAPGDPGTIGTLTLGSLTANSGLTMDFKLDGTGNAYGTDSDFIYVPTLTLNNVVTVNFASTDGSVATGVAYTLMYGGLGTWTAGNNLSFQFNAPAGYALDDTYGTPDGLPDGKDLGYVFDTQGDSLSVQFIAVPEPSAYGLLGLGLVGLVAIGRFRRLGLQ